MKANQTKTKAAEPARKSAPFFNKEAGQSYFQPIQTKLTVNEPGDPFEKEADRVADQVVQKMDKGTIGRKPIFESKNDEGVQRKAADPGGAGAVPASIEHGLAGSKGGGSSLPEGMRQEMEQTMGSDLSGVRLHNDDKANQMSKDLGAQAFTHGKDIYFNSGKYSPESKEGKHLLAHEVTHTVQQGAVRRTPSIQKVTPPKGGNAAANGKGPDTDSLYLPEFKSRPGRGKKIPKTVTYDPKYDRATAAKKTAADGPSEQAQIWDKAVEPTVTGKVENLIKAADKKNSKRKVPPDGPGEALYYLVHEKTRGQAPPKPKSKKGKGGGGTDEATPYQQTNLIGTAKTIAQSTLRPFWNKQGLAAVYDVDHIQELQLGGENITDNMELLNFSANRSSGSLIKNEVHKLIEQRKAASKPTTDPFTIKYGDAEIGFTRKAQGADFWSIEDIQKGTHLTPFVPMTSDEIIAASGEKNPVIYTSQAGGRGFGVNDLKAPGMTVNGYKPKAGMQDGKVVKGALDVTLQVPSTGKNFSYQTPVYEVQGVVNGGYIPRKTDGKGGLQKILSKLEIVGLSPADVDIADLDITKGMVIEGTIHPSLDFVKGTDLDFYVTGDEIGVSKTLFAGDIHLPSPFKVNEAFLTIGASNKGFYLTGNASFEVKGLGTGTIKGKATDDGSFGISGEFVFDKKLTKSKASVKVEYDNKNGWSISGHVELDSQIKGIKSGGIDVAYANGVFSATGTATPTIKGIKDVVLRIGIGPEVTEIEGDVTIDKMPGIKSGEGHLKIVKADDNYSFSGSGKIIPDIPKLSTEIDFSFHDDVFTVDATLNYVNDRLSGNLHVGITNADVDDQGKPTGKSKGEFRVYGGGDLTLKVTENITAMAGVNLLENGEIEVKGEITLPGKFEVVPNLLNIQDKDIISFPQISIPLFGIPLGVTTIGLEAFIRPKLTASAQIGPGSLTNVKAAVTYNPSQPENMTITGGADFEFIASAGIKVGVDMGVGLDAGLADVEGGINLSAFIQAAAEQPVFHTDIKYSPKTGFELNGDVKAMVKAMLGFSGTLFLEASVGVSFLKKTWRWEKELFKKVIDTGLEIGFEFPFGYKDGKSDVSFDKLKFKYPTFDEGLINRIKTSIVDPVKDQIFGDDD
jgi:hypothetical protein